MQNLLPPGVAFNKDPGSNLTNLLTGLAAEYARIHNRADDLRVDAHPTKTIELLEARYIEAGLPDPCSGRPESEAARRQEVVAQWAKYGGQSIAYYIYLMERYGQRIAITEYHPFRVDDETNSPIYGDNWQFVWEVTATASSYKHFNVGDSTVPDPLQEWGDTITECVLNRYKPAHTMLRFNLVIDESEIPLP
jgi:uncharacterized protein YmfQ (DUF2313 family)